MRNCTDFSPKVKSLKVKVCYSTVKIFGYSMMNRFTHSITHLHIFDEDNNILSMLILCLYKKERY